MSGPAAERESDVSADVLALLAERYDVMERIGSGGVGIVYRGVFRELNLPVAIKVLRSEYASDPEVFARFQREAASASSIGNPHIVQMVELATLPNGAAYLAMEYLQGQSLSERLAAGALGGDEAIGIGMQIIDALAACHQHNVVHRDLKPDNILLVDRGGRPSFVKIVDFGMARLLGSASKLTNQGAIIGTPHYMAPEQCKGQPADHRADIYSVGILLYRMLSGKLPFDGDKWLEVLSQQVHAEPVPPSRHLPPGALAPAVEAVILRAMQKDPAQRFQSMAEMMDALGEATRSGVFSELPAAPRPPAQGTADPVEPHPIGNLLAAALLTFVACGGAAWWWFAGR